MYMPLAGRSRVNESRCRTGHGGHFSPTCTYSRLSQLCGRVSIDQSTMAHTLKRMERDGQISRVPDPLDGRRAIIWLTERGARARGGPRQLRSGGECAGNRRIHR